MPRPRPRVLCGPSFQTAVAGAKRVRTRTYRVAGTEGLSDVLTMLIETVRSNRSPWHDRDAKSTDASQMNGLSTISSGWKRFDLMWDADDYFFEFMFSTFECPDICRVALL